MAANVHHRRSVRVTYRVLGFVSLGVGMLGLVLPLIPTTGPVLLAGFFFARSSERFHRWMLDHPRFGPAIRNYQAGLGIPRRAKILATVMIVLTFSLSMAFVVTATVGRVVLGLLAVGIIAFILSRPTTPANVVAPGGPPAPEASQKLS